MHERMPIQYDVTPGSADTKSILEQLAYPHHDGQQEATQTPLHIGAIRQEIRAALTTTGTGISTLANEASVSRVDQLPTLSMPAVYAPSAGAPSNRGARTTDQPEWPSDARPYTGQPHKTEAPSNIWLNSQPNEQPLFRQTSSKLPQETQEQPFADSPFMQHLDYLIQNPLAAQTSAHPSAPAPSAHHHEAELAYVSWQEEPVNVQALSTITGHQLARLAPNARVSEATNTNWAAAFLYGLRHTLQIAEEKQQPKTPDAPQLRHALSLPAVSVGCTAPAAPRRLMRSPLPFEQGITPGFQTAVHSTNPVATASAKAEWHSLPPTSAMPTPQHEYIPMPGMGNLLPTPAPLPQGSTPQPQKQTALQRLRYLVSFLYKPWHKHG